MPTTPTRYRFEITADMPGPLVCGTVDCPGCPDCTTTEGRSIDATNDVGDALAVVDELRRKGHHNVRITEATRKTLR